VKNTPLAAPPEGEANQQNAGLAREGKRAAGKAKKRGEKIFVAGLDRY
jgi:hypothetical protein